ncbi:NAD(P)H-dependent flavin oxidoreductase [Arhodomonas aquaeolei]|uniref:NAD(P)H-dependent flavin oxidoreductase n=1 Tax=Arhodomonas aquaeolei TaxID=2369 RepID=UPI000366A139|nr:nitronate monooxygenase [Arhodomonas aquaeolei]
MNSMESAAFRALFGVPYPVVQAPMAGVSTPALAAAVAEAGGLGSLGLGGSGVEQARGQIRELRALTAQPFNVNFFCHTRPRNRPAVTRAWLERLRPHFEAQHAEVPESLDEIYVPIDANPAMVAMLCEEQPPVVSFHFGVPGVDIVRSIHGYGGRVLISVTTPAEGQAAEAAGADAVVAQGIEAGGHRGNFDAGEDEALGLMPLVRRLVARLSVPVIASGGIMDGPGIRAVLALGAVGAQLGTAFIPCPESAATAAHRTALRSDSAARTAVTRAISGRPARGVAGVFQDEIGRCDDDSVPDYPLAYDAAKQLHAAARAAGSTAYSPNWAGQGAPLCREMPAGVLVARLVQELLTAPGGPGA